MNMRFGRRGILLCICDGNIEIGAIEIGARGSFVGFPNIFSPRSSLLSRRDGGGYGGSFDVFLIYCLLG